MKNKKGQDLSIGTLILIVLGIVVLVLLILGFTLGWDNLWEKVNIFGGSSIGTVVNACKLSTTSQDAYTFCEKTWKVTLDNGKKVTMGCRDNNVKGIDKSAFNNCEGYEPYIQPDGSGDETNNLPTCQGTNGLGGTLVPNLEACDPENNDAQDDGFKEADGTRICCIPN